MDCCGRLVVGFLLTLTTAAQACDGSASHLAGTPAAPSSGGVDCGPGGKVGPVLRFRGADGRPYKAVWFGQGTDGLVLAHQSDQTLCNEVPFARALARAGFLVLAADLRSEAPGLGLDQYRRWDVAVTAAISEVRSLGAKHVGVLGASQGGCAGLVGATEAKPPPDAVVSLSGERHVADLDCDAAAGRWSGALLIVSSAEDRYLNGADANALVAESPSSVKQLIVLPGGVHGMALLAQDDVSQNVIVFLKSHTTGNQS